MTLLDGQVLDGKYVITRRIAEGGMSTVYLGHNKRIGKDVAVKVLHPAVAREQDIVDRFEREARIVSRIRSQHVADVYDFGELETGERFMVMEYLEGESLATRIERERTLSARTLATIATQVLDALATAHAAGVVHRDLKPENIVVTTRNKELVVKVVDFGISKVIERENGASIFPGAKVTAAGAVLGTPLYMSPEQARGATLLVDHRTDIYSLGVILYEALSGEPPLTGDNVNDLLFRVALDEPIPLTKRAPNVDVGLAAIVEKAMAKHPANRYQTADEMRADLEAWKCIFASGAQAPVSFEGLSASIRFPSESAPPMTVVTPMALSAPSGERPASPRPVRSRVRKLAFAAPMVAAFLLLAIPGSRHMLRLQTGERTLTTTTAVELPAAAEPAAVLPLTPAAAPVQAPEPKAEPTPEPPAVVAIAVAAPPPPVAALRSLPAPRRVTVKVAHSSSAGDAGAAEPMVVVEPAAETDSTATASE